MNYRKKLSIAEAEQYEDTKAGHRVILAFCPRGSFSHGMGREFFDIGYRAAAPGDWIIKNNKGEFYVYTPAEFEATYEVATPAPPLAELREAVAKLEWERYSPSNATITWDEERTSVRTFWRNQADELFALLRSKGVRLPE